MRADEFLIEWISIPMGRRGRATVSVPDILYHSLRKRKLGPNGNIQGYNLSPKEDELKSLWVEPSDDGYVWLSQHPLDSSALKIDVRKLNTNNLRYTGQSEGYILHKGSIPKEAIIQ